MQKSQRCEFYVEQLSANILNHYDTFMNPPFKDHYIMHYCDDTCEKYLLHMHSSYEIMLILQGNISLHAQGTRHPIPSGSLVFIPPHIMHCTVISADTRTYERFVLHLKKEYVDRLVHELSGFELNKVIISLPLFITCSADKTIQLLSQMKTVYCEQWHIHDSVSHVITDNSILTLLLLLYRFASARSLNNPVAADNCVLVALNYIEEHFQDMDFSAQSLKDIVYMSYGNLSRLFKNYTGISIYQYIIQRRLSFAYDLILQGTHVIDACMESGFKEYTSFLKAFKKNYDTTPRQILCSNKKSSL